MLWAAGPGEQARLTPEGPTAAVIESGGELPLRVRTSARFAHPGTAVSLGGLTYEVVALERLDGRVLYRLDPWPDDHVQRNHVVYGASFVAGPLRDRGPTVVRGWPGAGVVRLLLEAAVALLPERQRATCAARHELDAVRGSRVAAAVGVLVGGLAWGGLLVASMRKQVEASAGQLRDFTNVTPVTGDVSPLYFVFSPLGLALGYLALTSLVRLVHVGLNDEPWPDPVLALAAALPRAFDRERPATPVPGPLAGEAEPSPPGPGLLGRNASRAGTTGSRIRIDEGEEARLTPGGPSAAVVESLGALPLRARRESTVSHQPTFPGTAVMIGEAMFEVVAEDPLELGMRYRLEPWPSDHIVRDVVRYGPPLVRRAQRERERAVEVERRRRWSWLLHPFVGLLPESRQIMACERLGLDAAHSTLAGAMLEALLVFLLVTGDSAPLEAMKRREGLGFGWVNEAGFLMSTALIRGFGALAFG
jgi:hypothetical protein